MFTWFRRVPAAPTKEQLRVAHALASYPPFAPPAWEVDPKPDATRAASFQYRDHFLGGRSARLEALREFLGNFDVILNTDDAGLMEVSIWLPRWADLIVNDFNDQAISNAYRRFEVPWTGKLAA